MTTSKRKTLAWAFFWLVLVGAIGWLDYATGPAFGFGFFYLLAILPAAWLHGRTVGIVVAAAASMAWFLADAAVRPESLVATLWNAPSRGFLFFAGALLVNRLQHERARLVQTNADRARFLRVLERELPRPATVLVQALDGLLKKGQADRDQLVELRHEAEGMLFLARDFLALGQLQSGPLTFVRRPVDLRSLINEIVHQRSDRVRILINIVEGGPLVASTDPARLGQAFTAILDEAGAGTNEDVRIDVERDAASIRLSVSVGVPRNESMLRPALDDERIVGFELARLIVEALGGSLTLFRRPVSRGLRVVFSLPAAG